MIEGARPATMDDLGQIAELIHLAHAELALARGGIVLLRRDARPLPPADGVEDLLDAADSQVVVGTIDEVVVGYGVVRSEVLRDGGRLARIEDLYVREEARKVGVGHALVEAMAEWSHGQRCFAIEAMVLPGDRSSKNFFEEEGMRARALVVHRSLDIPGEEPTPGR